MLLPIFILCLSHLLLASPAQPEYDVGDIEQLRYHFNDFKVKYNRHYAADEEELRLSYFKANLVEIMEMRKRNPFAEFDINKFADWSPQEKENLTCLKGDQIAGDMGKCYSILPVDMDFPDVLDYRDMNAVTPAQDQGACGACWAFSATGAVEGSFALKHNYLLKLSEQQLVDCDPASDGCDGGLMHYAFSTLMVQGGQQLERDYPYQNKSKAGNCAFNHSEVRVELLQCSMRKDVEEVSMRGVLFSEGPVSIALDHRKLLGYTKGIITDCNDDSIVSHAVLLIGYGRENNIPYWLIKNSWGADWGDEGFVKVQRVRNCLGIGKYLATVSVKPPPPRP